GQYSGGLRSREGYKSRKKSKKGFNFIALIVLLVVFFFLLFGRKIFDKYIPSKEEKNLNEWFEVSGEKVRLHLNDKRDNEITAIAKDGELYIPIAWAKENINKRFFWNPEEDLLVYTLPDQILHYDSNSVTDDGHKAYISLDDGMYISYSLIEKYTDVRASLFIAPEEPAKRAFIYKDRGEYTRATVKKNASLRTRTSIKEPVLTKLVKGERVTVLEESEKWAKITTSSGFTGYVEKKKLIDYSKEQDTPVYSDPVPKYYDLGEKVVMGWHQVTNKDANASMESFVANAGGKLNVISPTWIQISSKDGDYINLSSKEYVDRAHELGLKVWPTVDNFNNPVGFKEFSTRDYFANSKNRQSFISRLMADAESYGYDGFNLDFEALPQDAGESYAQFYRELAVECRSAGLALSIDNYVPYHFNEHYDLSEQGYFADYVIIMGYDEYTNASGEAGPVASLPYVRNGIEKTIAKVPHERVINAVPFYTRIWTEENGKVTSRAVGIKSALKFAAENEISFSFDEELGLNYGEKTIDGVPVKIWMEDEKSLERKIALVDEYGLAGIACWRLNYEPAEIWSLFNIN
ncbi:MAG: glycosyl hydrolase family 18 protein, partial [Eubacteriales bacterium]|nr:glycosyl hydrolase family 18 protein [Eubacteriales bacterium]